MLYKPKFKVGDLIHEDTFKGFSKNPKKGLVLKKEKYSDINSSKIFYEIYWMDGPYRFRTCTHFSEYIDRYFHLS